MSDNDVNDFSQMVQMHRPQNLIVKVTRFDDAIVGPLRASLTILMETNAVVIDGFNNNLSVIQGEGGIRVVPDDLVPHFVHAERYGKAIENAYTELIKVYAAKGAGFDVMFIEPDPTRRHVLSAWHCKHMRVKRLVGAESKRDIRIKPSHNNAVDVFFDCTVERGIDTVKEATTMLREMNLVGANPHTPSPVA